MRSIAITGIVVGGLGLGMNLIVKNSPIPAAAAKAKRLGGGLPDLANADLLVTVTDAGVSAPISAPIANPQNAVIDKACFDYSNRTWQISGWGRDQAGGDNLSSFMLTYEMKSGNVLWKNAVVDNQPPGALSSMMNTIATKGVQLVLKKIVVPDTIR